MNGSPPRSLLLVLLSNPGTVRSQRGVVSAAFFFFIPPRPYTPPDLCEIRNVSSTPSGSSEFYLFSVLLPGGPSGLGKYSRGRGRFFPPNSSPS